jgi:hypothetical protein
MMHYSSGDVHVMNRNHDAKPAVNSGMTSPAPATAYRLGQPEAECLGFALAARGTGPSTTSKLQKLSPSSICKLSD